MPPDGWLADLLPARQMGFIRKGRSNMNSVQLTPFDQAHFKPRSLIETVFDHLKNLCQIEHTRHSSHANPIVNLMSGIVAYSLALDKARYAYTMVP